MGSKLESFVVPNVVFPAKVNAAPVWRARLIVLEAGAETPDNRMLVHDLTADEMLAYAVTVQSYFPVTVGVVVVPAEVLDVVLAVVV